MFSLSSSLSSSSRVILSFVSNWHWSNACHLNKLQFKNRNMQIRLKSHGLQPITNLISLRSCVLCLESICQLFLFITILDASLKEGLFIRLYIRPLLNHACPRITQMMHQVVCMDLFSFSSPSYRDNSFPSKQRWWLLFNMNIWCN